MSLQHFIARDPYADGQTTSCFTSRDLAPLWLNHVVLKVKVLLVTTRHLFRLIRRASSQREFCYANRLLGLLRSTLTLHFIYELAAWAGFTVIMQLLHQSTLLVLVCSLREGGRAMI